MNLRPLRPEGKVESDTMTPRVTIECGGIIDGNEDQEPFVLMRQDSWCELCGHRGCGNRGFCRFR